MLIILYNPLVLWDLTISDHQPSNRDYERNFLGTKQLIAPGVIKRGDRWEILYKW